MGKLTLDEFCNQWVSGKWSTYMVSKLENNIFDFTTAAGDYSKKQFVSSFSSGGFCGTKWAPRTSRWGKRFTHPVMIDSETLSKSIKSDVERIDITGRRDDRSRIYRKGAKYSIWTTEKSVPIEKKRGKHKKGYANYAAVHNTDPKFGLYAVNQYSKRPPVHRQFIGFNDAIDDYIESNFLDMIFEGFPQ